MQRTFPLLLLAFVTSLSSFAALDPDKPALSPEISDTTGVDFFEKKIRPVLADKCYKCHSADAEKVKGGLLLDSREGMRRGGDSGPAVVPGNLKESLLIEAIHYGNKDFAMPPKKSGGKLGDEIIKDFEKWIAMGAPDPREEKKAGASAKTAAKTYDYEKAKEWWAWKPPVKPSVPTVKNSAWPRADTDKFLLAAMEAKGITPVADADRLTLIRRVYFDLVGVPPSLPEVDAFLKDKSSDAYLKVVDRLLASPQFGERWGRHWLDVARFAESSGKDVNIAFPHAWRYRDYVVDSFNADKPYDQFIREQIAGDLLPAANDKQRAEQLTATGFLAVGTKGLNEQNPRQFALDVADEQIDTVSQAVLGMTVACARCHDHKFDPIPQRDYYALAGIFTSTDTRYGTPFNIQNRHPSELIELPKSAGVPIAARGMTPEDRAQKEQKLAELKKEQQQFAAERLGQRMTQDGGKPARNDAQANLRRLAVVAQLGMLEVELKSVDEGGQPKALAMGAQDLPVTRPRPAGFGDFVGQRLRERFVRPPELSIINDCVLYARGDVEKPGEKVPRGFPSIVSQSTTPEIPGNESGRKQLAQWLTDDRNPLTARVMTNRVWKWIFGEGIVSSTDNFGTTGNKPSNQALLDSLALNFEANGWSVKKLVREIVLSHAYQLSSVYDAKNFAADPENTLVWRMSKRRLDAECIRDAMLTVSGQLDTKRPVGDAIAFGGDGPIGPRRPFAGGTGEEAITGAGANSNARSVYLPVARDIVPESLAVFDFAETSMVVGSRETTNVPSQALYMLNSGFVTKQAKTLADRVMKAYPSGANAGVAANLDERVNYAYWLVFSRPPDDVEKRAALDFLMKFPGAWKKGDTRTAISRDTEAMTAAWTSLCRALFASAEFRYVN